MTRVMQYFGRSRRSVGLDLVEVSRVDTGCALVFSLPKQILSGLCSGASVSHANALLFRRPIVWLVGVGARCRSAVSPPIDLVPDELPMPHPILGLLSL